MPRLHSWHHLIRRIVQYDLDASNLNVNQAIWCVSKDHKHSEGFRDAEIGTIDWINCVCIAANGISFAVRWKSACIEFDNFFIGNKCQSHQLRFGFTFCKSFPDTIKSLDIIFSTIFTHSFAFIRLDVGIFEIFVQRRIIFRYRKLQIDLSKSLRAIQSEVQHMKVEDCKYFRFLNFSLFLVQILDLEISSKTKTDSFVIKCWATDPISSI